MFRMMTILCFLGLLLLTTNPLAAEVNKLPKGDIPTLFTRAPCDPLPKMLQTMKKYKEELDIINDMSDDDVISVFSNSFK